tara:strand:+ start:289 stop:1326 length:1038 start_codon:yes stop_codon:yes gene_type:complete
MAKFFNQKQDVIDIELTKYGEYLLSLGKFNPTYYAFYDNNILYDTRYANFSASQNSFEPRIQEETPSLRTIASFEGRETQVLEYNTIVADDPRLREDEKIRFQSTPDRHYTSLIYPLGNSDLSADKAPAWNMTFMNNSMDHVDLNLTGSHAMQRIPQITSKIEYKTKIGNQGGDMENLPTDADVVLQEGVYVDGSYVEVEPDYILMDLQELNAPFEMKNFDIEVYEIKDETLKNGDTREQLIPLKFKKKKEEIVNNLLVDAESGSRVLLDPSFVEYYFDVFVDSEVDEVIICKSINNLKSKGIYVETEFNCPDIASTVNPLNPYSTLDIESPSDECATDLPGGGS